MLPSIYNPQQPFTLGIIGGGQLAKMLAQSAYQLGLHVAVIEHGQGSPAGIMATHEFPDGWTNSQQLEQFILASDIITLENEFVSPDILENIGQRRYVWPSAETMRLVQDKFLQKQTFSAAGIPVPRFAALNTIQEAEQFGELGYPFVLKTRTLGYDGYGNATIQRATELPHAFQRFTTGDVPKNVMGEEFVTFNKELAVMVARNKRGEIAVYPCVQTIQQSHICVTVLAPAPIETHLQQKAQQIAVACVETIGGVGIFGIELFLTPDDNLLFNEIAPRPHNSAHYTIEACHTSQFENCIRAVTNMPLGSTKMRTPAAAMINVLGERGGSGIPDTVLGTLATPGVALHLYGKKESRKGRKMGHLTATGETVNQAFQQASTALDSLVW
jgi:5-(carboxyamino)imidazole ribonucleotide synthase